MEEYGGVILASFSDADLFLNFFLVIFRSVNYSPQVDHPFVKYNMDNNTIFIPR
jgi:hypothetical protein